MYLFILLILIFLIIVFFILNFIAKSTFSSLITRKLHDQDEHFALYCKNSLVDKKLYEDVKKEDLCLSSHDNLKLYSTLIMNKKKTNKFIVLVHGVSIGFVGSLKYFDIFYRNDFNILIVHQRRHGKSEGKYTTYGYYEKQDLNLWLDYLKNRFGNDIILGLHGESMGAGTVMQTLPLNPSIKFVIEDCGYSDLSELLKFQASYSYPKIIYPMLLLSLKICNLMSVRRAKFKFKDVSPIKIISETEIPVMFIHGTNDYFVPWYMAKDLFNAKCNGYKDIYLVDNADHAEALAANKIEYEYRVISFINKVLN